MVGQKVLPISMKLSSRQVHPRPAMLDDAPIIQTNCAKAIRFFVTLSDDRILGNPVNAIDGQQYVWEVIQDSVGNRLLDFDTKFGFGSDVPSVELSTEAGLRDFITAIYNSDTDMFYIVGLARGY